MLGSYSYHSTVKMNSNRTESDTILSISIPYYKLHYNSQFSNINRNYDYLVSVEIVLKYRDFKLVCRGVYT